MMDSTVEILNASQPVSNESPAVICARQSHPPVLSSDALPRIRELEEENQTLKRLNALQGSRVEVLQDVASLLRSSQRPHEVLDQVMDLVVEVMRVEAGSMLLIDASGQGLRFEIAKGEKADAVKHFRLKLGEGIAGWVAQRGEPLIVPDVHRDPRFRSDISETIDFPTQSILCGPIIGRSGTLGVIEVINRLDGEQFNEKDLQLLQALSNQAALMLENSRILNRAERQLAGLDALKEVAVTISTPNTLNLQTVLEHLLEVSVDLTEAESGTIFLHDEDVGELRLGVAVGFPQNKLPKQTVRIGESITGQVAKTGAPRIVSDVDPATAAEDPHSTEVRSMLSVPLRRMNRTIGVLNVVNRRDQDAFSEDDLSLLLAFASQSVAAIENARWYEEAQRKIEELTTLVGVSSMIASELDLDQLLTTIMDLACQVMKAEASSLMLLDEVSNDLAFRVALGEKGEEVKQYRIKIGEGIAGWVAEHREPLLVEDVSRDKRFKKEIADSIDFPTKSIICVPVIVKEKLIGVIEVINRVDGTHFDRRDQSLLSAIASEAGIALENARLYRDLRSLYLNVIEALARTIDVKDSYTHDHSRRVTLLAQAISKEMGFPEEQMDFLQIAGLFHDIGKLGVDGSILHKAARLDDEEYETLKKHALIASDIVGEIKPWKHIVPWIRHTHECYDGSGYPAGLKGDEIPLPSRIIAIADSYDAMTSDRPYRERLDRETAIARVTEQSGKQFDPEVVNAFLNAVSEGRTPAQH